MCTDLRTSDVLVSVARQLGAFGSASNGFKSSKWLFVGFLRNQFVSRGHACEVTRKLSAVAVRPLLNSRR